MIQAASHRTRNGSGTICQSNVTTRQTCQEKRECLRKAAKLLLEKHQAIKVRVPTGTSNRIGTKKVRKLENILYSLKQKIKLSSFQLLHSGLVMLTLTIWSCIAAQHYKQRYSSLKINRKTKSNQIKFNTKFNTHIQGKKTQTDRSQCAMGHERRSS